MLAREKEVRGGFLMQTVKVAKDYRILIPAKVRNILPLKVGDELEMMVEESKSIKLVPKKTKKEKNNRIGME